MVCSQSLFTPLSVAVQAARFVLILITEDKVNAYLSED
jgi:hypothetical protein